MGGAVRQRCDWRQRDALASDEARKHRRRRRGEKFPARACARGPQRHAGPVLEPSSSAPDEVPEVLGAALVAPAAGRGGPAARGALIAGAAEPDCIFELPWGDIEFHSPEPSPMRKLGAANRRTRAKRQCAFPADATRLPRSTSYLVNFAPAIAEITSLLLQCSLPLRSAPRRHADTHASNPGARPGAAATAAAAARLFASPPR